jgi:hypothetical protein
MMTDTVIHVGLPKTGSTFIQENVLSASEDVFYVGRPYTQEGQAFNMIQYCDDSIYNAERVQEELNNLRRRADGKRIVISDEMLAGSPLYGFRNRSSIARRLQRHFPEAEIILCLRNQVDLLQSYFKQITAMGWNGRVLDRNYVHRSGSGLSFEDWREGTRWDKTRRVVSHHSLISVEYFKYTRLYECYDQLFDEVSVLLFEDFQEKQDAFFEKWASISGHTTKTIRRQAEERVNAVDEQGVRDQLLANRAAAFMRDVDVKGKKLLEKIVAFLLRPFFPDDVMNCEYVLELVRDAGIPEDNRKLAEFGRANLKRHASTYLLDL